MSSLLERAHPNVVYGEGQTHHLYTLQEKPFRQKKNPSFTVKVFKGGLKGGLNV